MLPRDQEEQDYYRLELPRDQSASVSIDQLDLVALQVASSKQNQNTVQSLYNAIFGVHRNGLCYK